MASTNGTRPIDLIKATWDPTPRAIQWPGIEGLTLYFPPLTPAAWGKARSVVKASGGDPDDANELGIRLLVEIAQLEDGTAAFALADAVTLRRQTRITDLQEVINFMTETGPVVLGDERVTEAQELVNADPT